MTRVTYQAACPRCGEMVTWVHVMDSQPTIVDHVHPEDMLK